MTVDVAKYFAQLDNKKGKLERWETDIFQLHQAGVSYQNIADFLKLNGAESSKTEVYRFIHRKKRRHLLVEKSKTPVTSKKSNEGNSPAAAKVTTEPSQDIAKEQPAGHQESPSRPKFKFRESLDKDKTKW